MAFGQQGDPRESRPPTPVAAPLAHSLASQGRSLPSLGGGPGGAALLPDTAAGGSNRPRRRAGALATSRTPDPGPDAQILLPSSTWTRRPRRSMGCSIRGCGRRSSGGRERARSCTPTPVALTLTVGDRSVAGFDQRRDRRSSQPRHLGNPPFSSKLGCRPA